MNLDDLKIQLKHKAKTINDLARFIKTRTDSNPNYTLLLGAGASVTSGIRSAASLCKVWRDEIYTESSPDTKNCNEEDVKLFLKDKFSDWYDANREYSCLFEKKYDLQRQRRMFVENEVNGKLPSIGYIYLMSLIDDSYLNTVFTTNFDDLINEAFYLYSKQRPIVCAHDSSINSVTVTSRRPKIIKLHGDYLFDDIKATTKETDSLEKNIKDKFIEFAKDFGMIVVGYAGGDRSVVDTITMLLKNEEYFKNGIYWCIRKGSDVPEELRKLLFKDRVYFVEIDGFDELFSEVFSQLNPDEIVPRLALTVSTKPAEILEKLLNSEYAFPQTNDILKRAKTKLSKISKRVSIGNLIFNKNDENEINNTQSSLSEDDILMFMELESKIREGRYDDAIKSAKEISFKKTSKNTRKKLLNLIINAHGAKEENDLAINVIDELIALEPSNPINYLKKIKYTNASDKELSYINKALELDPQILEGHIEKANYYGRLASRTYDAERVQNRVNQKNALSHCLLLNPNYKNIAYSKIYSLIINDGNLNLETRNEELNKIETILALQNKNSYQLLNLKVMRADASKDLNQYKNIFEAIQKIIDSDYRNNDFIFDTLLIKLLLSDKDSKNLKSKLDVHVNELKFSSDADFSIQLASAYRIKFGDEVNAEKILNTTYNNLDFDSDLFDKLFELFIDLKRIDDVKNLLNKHKLRFNSTKINLLNAQIYISNNEYEKAEIIYKKMSNNTDNNINVDRIGYVLLLQKNYSEAENIFLSFLNKCNHSKEAKIEMINYAFCLKKQNKSFDKSALNFIKSSKGSTPEIKAAIHALLNDFQECFLNLKLAYQDDKTFKYRAAEWPILEDLKSKPDWNNIFGL